MAFFCDNAPIDHRRCRGTFHDLYVPAEQTDKMYLSIRQCIKRPTHASDYCLTHERAHFTHDYEPDTQQIFRKGGRWLSESVTPAQYIKLIAEYTKDATYALNGIKQTQTAYNTNLTRFEQPPSSPRKKYGTKLVDVLDAYKQQNEKLREHQSVSEARLEAERLFAMTLEERRQLKANRLMPKLEDKLKDEPKSMLNPPNQLKPKQSVKSMDTTVADKLLKTYKQTQLAKQVKMERKEEAKEELKRRPQAADQFAALLERKKRQFVEGDKDETEDVKEARLKANKLFSMTVEERKQLLEEQRELEEEELVSLKQEVRLLLKKYLVTEHVALDKEQYITKRVSLLNRTAIKRLGDEKFTALVEVTWNEVIEAALELLPGLEFELFSILEDYLKNPSDYDRHQYVVQHLTETAKETYYALGDKQSNKLLDETIGFIRDSEPPEEEYKLSDQERRRLVNRITPLLFPKRLEYARNVAQAILFLAGHFQGKDEAFDDEFLMISSAERERVVRTSLRQAEVKYAQLEKDIGRLLHQSVVDGGDMGTNEYVESNLDDELRMYYDQLSDYERRDMINKLWRDVQTKLYPKQNPDQREPTEQDISSIIEKLAGIYEQKMPETLTEGERMGIERLDSPYDRQLASMKSNQKQNIVRKAMEKVKPQKPSKKTKKDKNKGTYTISDINRDLRMDYNDIMAKANGVRLKGRSKKFSTDNHDEYRKVLAGIQLLLSNDRSWDEDELTRVQHYPNHVSVTNLLPDY
jgi:hypothetical protein